jgi:putative FmdB family regulatory protein
LNCVGECIYNILRNNTAKLGGFTMALLDFRCEDCKEKFSELVNSSNRDKIECPKCKSREIRQVFEGKCSTVGAAGGKSGCSSGSCGGCSGCH